MEDTPNKSDLEMEIESDHTEVHLEMSPIKESRVPKVQMIDLNYSKSELE